jgi:hypothetical protein
VMDFDSESTDFFKKFTMEEAKERSLGEPDKDAVYNPIEFDVEVVGVKADDAVKKIEELRTQSLIDWTFNTGKKFTEFRKDELVKISDEYEVKYAETKDGYTTFSGYSYGIALLKNVLVK